MALPSPFADKPQKHPGFQDDLLSRRMRPIFAHPEYSKLGFAVGSMSYPYVWAGLNIHQTRFSGSVVKIAALFAFHQLHHSVNLACRALGTKPKKSDELFQLITDAWRPIVEKAVPGPKNFPDLAGIFDPVKATSHWNLEFKREIDKDLEDMISKSDTSASGRCIRLIKHQYINGALAKEGLYTTKDGGIWLGGDYNQIEYQADPKSSVRSHYTTTPFALMRFLMLLRTDALVSPGASSAMRAVMDNFYLPRFLRSERRPFLENYGKLGWEEVGKVKVYFDAGVVERVPPRAAKFKYGLVVLGPTALWIKPLALALDDVIQTI